MGLDMNVMRTSAKLPAAVDFETHDQEGNALFPHADFWYWRKHPNLHGWMDALYREKGGEDAEFNCVPVQLTAEDLDALETAVSEGSLPHTEGFFFGRSTGDEKDDDLAFIAKAREVLASGESLFYVSSW